MQSPLSILKQYWGYDLSAACRKILFNLFWRERYACPAADRRGKIHLFPGAGMARMDLPCYHPTDRIDERPGGES